MLILPVVLNACATVGVEERLIQAEEQVYLQYTCFNQKALAITTDLDQVDKTTSTTHYFKPPIEPGPVLVPAGQRRIHQMNEVPLTVNFNEAVSSYLAEAMVGKPYGRPVNIAIKGAVLEKVSKKERFTTLRRHSSLNGRFWVPLDQTKADFGDNIQKGDVFPHKDYPTLSYYIEDIKDDKVYIKMLFEDGTTFDHLFGKIRFVHIDEDRCEQIFDTHVGFIVRSGPLLGRVIRVDEQSFTIDFGDPLAGQTLSCEVVGKVADTPHQAAVSK